MLRGKLSLPGQKKQQQCEILNTAVTRWSKSLGSVTISHEVSKALPPNNLRFSALMYRVEVVRAATNYFSIFILK